MTRTQSPDSGQLILELTRLQSNGSGKKANAYGYLVGGKTGTAEKVSVNGGFQKKTNLTSFVGAFPIHEPKYLVLF